MNERLSSSKHASYEREILSQLAARRETTQRDMARDLGIALGLTNLLVRRLVDKRWVSVERTDRRRVRYVITRAGLAAKTRLTREHFIDSLRHYSESRTRILERLLALARQHDSDANAGIVFYGAGEAAEIAFACLQETPLQLVGVVCPPPRRFFNTDVHAVEALHGHMLDGRPFWRLVVMPPQDVRRVRELLASRHVPADRVFWL